MEPLNPPPLLGEVQVPDAVQVRGEAPAEVGDAVAEMLQPYLSRRFTSNPTPFRSMHFSKPKAEDSRVSPIGIIYFKFYVNQHDIFPIHQLSSHQPPSRSQHP